MGFTVIYAVLIFCLLIFVHEFGHFAAAKAVGVRVNKFALGMGPALLHFQGKETEYSLRLLPIGGYCQMEGEDDDSDDPRAFHKKAAWQKAIVVVAGAAMNLLTCIVIITFMLAAMGGVGTTGIGAVSPGSPAAAAGLQANDKIVDVNGIPVKSWTDITRTIADDQSGITRFTVKRDGETVKMESGVGQTADGRKVVGISSHLSKNPFLLLKSAAGNTVNMAGQMFSYLGQLVTGHGSMDDLVGPVGIVSLINDEAKQGLLAIANLTALLSLNLAIVNMLPLPALDGGRLLFLIIRKCTGKAITDETEGKIHFVGMMLLFGFMLFMVVKDVNRFIL